MTKAGEYDDKNNHSLAATEPIPRFLLMAASVAAAADIRLLILTLAGFARCEAEVTPAIPGVT